MVLYAFASSFWEADLREFEVSVVYTERTATGSQYVSLSGLELPLSAVLKLWISTSLEIESSSHRGLPRPSENTDTYITIQNSSKITVKK